VKEAIDHADRAIDAAKRRGDTTINIIVGLSFSFFRQRVALLTEEGPVSR
jgi:hypothetical protein